MERLGGWALSFQGVDCFLELGLLSHSKHKNPFPVHYVYLKGKTGPAFGKPLNCSFIERLHMQTRGEINWSSREQLNQVW